MDHDRFMRKLAIRNTIIFLVPMTVVLILNSVRLLDSVSGLELFTVILISISIGVNIYHLKVLIKDRN